MLGVSSDVPELEGEIGLYKGVSSKVASVANFFGVSEILTIIGQSSDIDCTRADAPKAQLIGGPLSENTRKAKFASVVTYVTANGPPVLTVHGTEERTVSYAQAARLETVLRKVCVLSYFVTVKGAGHGDFGTLVLPLDNRVKAFFDKYLHRQCVEVSTAMINWRKFQENKDDK